MKILWQIPAILLISVVLAMGYNQIRTTPLPLFYSWSKNISKERLKEYSQTISVEEAAALYHNNKAIFIDARPESAYNQGHIRGALCLPWHEAEDKFFDVVENIPPDMHIITYCDGSTCDLSEKLAGFLSDLGFEQVQVLANGWTVWKQHHLPVDLPEQQS